MGQAQPTAGNASSEGVNQLDSAPIVHFNSSKVKDVLFSDQNQTVTFPPWTKSLKCVRFNKTLHKSVENQSFCVRLKLSYEDYCQVVVGLQCVNVKAVSTDASQYVLLDITGGRVYSMGVELAKVKLPICMNNGEIELQFDLSSGQIQYTVSNPGVPVMHCPPIQLNSIPDVLLPAVGVLSTSRQPVTARMIAAEGSLYPQFDTSTSHGPILISQDGLTAKREGCRGNCCVLINRVLTRGKHSWVLKIVDDKGASTCLGVAKVPLAMPTKYSEDREFLYSHPDMYLWRSYKGRLYRNGVEQEQCMVPSNWISGITPLTMKLTMDMDDGTLSLHGNNVPLGTAFKGLDGPLQPVLVFYSSYDKHVQLVSYQCSPMCSIALSHTTDPPLPANVLPDAYFDFSTAKGLVKVSEDGTTLTRAAGCSGNAYCLLNKYCTSGIHRWSFRSHGNQGVGVCLGVTLEPIVMPTNEDIYMSSSMCVVREGGVYLNGRLLAKKVKEKWACMEVVCDLVNWVVEVLVDGVSQGIICALEKGYYRPVVGFYDHMEQKVSLEHYEHVEVPVLLPATRGPGVNEVDDPKEEGPTPSDQLPLAPRVKEALDMCITCSIANSNILILPCKHVVYCPLCAAQTTNCIICNTPITGFWNIF